MLMTSFDLVNIMIPELDKSCATWKFEEAWNL